MLYAYADSIKGVKWWLHVMLSCKFQAYPSIDIKRKCQDHKVSFKGSSIASY